MNQSDIRMRQNLCRRLSAARRRQKYEPGFSRSERPLCPTSHTNASGLISTSHIVASHITKLLLSFRQILQFRFRDNPQGRIPPWKVTKTRPFLSTCYGDPSATEVPPCCEAATTKLTFSTTSVLLLLNMPLSLYRGTIFRLQKNPRRGYSPKIAGILFVCNEPEGKYYTVPGRTLRRPADINNREQWRQLCAV